MFLWNIVLRMSTSEQDVHEDHAETAIDFADEADAYTERLQQLYGADRRDSEEIAQVHQRLRTSIKLAEINALLAIADEVRRVREHLQKDHDPRPIILEAAFPDGDPV